MSTEIAVLRTLLRFSRRRTPATLADLLDRVPGDAADVQRALASLARGQLVARRTDEHARMSVSLTLPGLAVAVAAAAQARQARQARQAGTRAKTVARPSKPSARIVPLVRRRHTAAA